MAGTSRLATGIAVAAVVGYAWIATGFARFSWSVQLAVGIPGFVLLTIAYRTKRPRLALPTRGWRRRGVATWAVVLALLAAWELFTFSHGHRAQWPTASSMLATADTSHPVRAVVFLLWLALGLDLIRR